MNIPEIYLVEPYNAYAPKQKKKHWMQEVEEQALLARILAEQQSLREAANKTSNTLPPQAPPTAHATAQASSGGEGAAGGPNTTGGGGGAPRPQFYNPESGSYTFTASPSTSSAYSAIQFSLAGGASTLALGGANVLWLWGDGTTGGGITATHVYSGTGSFTPSVKITSPYTNALIGVQTQSVTMSVPTVTGAFTVTGATVTLSNGFYTASHGDTLVFINGATSSGPYNPLTYLWNFGSASVSSSATNPALVFTNTSSAAGYTVILGVSGSFNVTATGSRNILIT